MTIAMMVILAPLIHAMLACANTTRSQIVVETEFAKVGKIVILVLIVLVEPLQELNAEMESVKLEMEKTVSLVLPTARGNKMASPAVDTAVVMAMGSTLLAARTPHALQGVSFAQIFL